MASTLPDRSASGLVAIGISSCLLGEPVRWNGGDKLAPWIRKILEIPGGLDARVRFQPICPEMEIGLGAPRPPIRLVGEPHRTGAQAQILLQAVQAVQAGEAGDSNGITDALRKLGRQTARRPAGISGYIFKAHSPSCGLSGVPVFSREAIGPGGEPTQGPIGETRGLFAAAIVESLPGLPVAEEGGLRDAGERADFLRRVFAYARERGPG